MRTRYDHTRRILLWLLTALMAGALILFMARAAAAQCVANPTGETAVGLKNGSSHYLLFFVDGFRMDGVPPGDRSAYFVVEAGEHVLRAESVINGETRSAIRTGDVPEGDVCMWTVTDPPDRRGGWARGMRDSLGAETKRDFARTGRTSSTVSAPSPRSGSFWRVVRETFPTGV
jgi:hypothetical protein